MGKFVMPSVNEFLKLKRISGPKKDPVWVFLEAEMQANINKKPYNNTVGNWLLFLRDLHAHYIREARQKYQRLRKECSPDWYYEFSKGQRSILANLSRIIHIDLSEDIPDRIKRSLWDLGITTRFPYDMLMDSMKESLEDAGLFMWILFEKYYKQSPMKVLPMGYNMNAMIMMSSIVFCDIDECIESLQGLMTLEKKKSTTQQKKKAYYYEPNIKYGSYLSKMKVPLTSTHPNTIEPKKKPQSQLATKLKMLTENAYARLAADTKFLELRRQRNIKMSMMQRKCKYKFWEPPVGTFRNVSKKQAEIMLKLRMYKSRAKVKHTKYCPYENSQLHITSVSFSSGRPVYVLSTFVSLPTGAIPINGGVVLIFGQYVTLIIDFWHSMVVTTERCPENCNCLTSWESQVMDYLNSTRCYCKHAVDFDIDGKAPRENRYFYAPTLQTPCWFDLAKVYQQDPWWEYTREALQEALASETVMTTQSSQPFSISVLTEKQLLRMFLAELAETPLLIPHMPDAHLLKNLQVWVRKRVQGGISDEKHRQLTLKSQRRWLDLKHMDFRARAYFIPFTQKQLANMNWSHRYKVQKLFKKLLGDFEMRSRKLQMEQSRLWWNTMEYDNYPNEPFLDVFFTYMPGRYKDTHVLNPYTNIGIPKSGSKACPLD